VSAMQDTKKSEKRKGGTASFKDIR